jgi:hypothetical protein
MLTLLVILGYRQRETVAGRYNVVNTLYNVVSGNPPDAAKPVTRGAGASLQRRGSHGADDRQGQGETAEERQADRPELETARDATGISRD